MKPSTYSKYWPWFFLTAAFESLAASAALFSIPTEKGLSLARFILLAILLACLTLFIYLGVRVRQKPGSLDFLARPSVMTALTLLVLTSGFALFQLRYLDPVGLLPYYQRLSPILWFLLVVGVQSIAFLLLIRNGFNLEEGLKRRSVYRAAGLPFIGLILVLILVSLTKLGITPDSAYWGEPGVAILGWQTALAILIGFCVLLLVRPSASSRLVAFILPLGLWVLASVLWLGVPIEALRSSFYAPITPPANLPFPYSDAGFYDYLAQSLLIGTNYLGSIPPRPLYVVFLAGLHFFFGQDYKAMITAQTLLLALFPVALYFLGRKLHTPAAGVTVALFGIFREWLGLWIASNTRVVNSKIFTTDFPSALGIVVMCLLAIRWLEKRDLRSTLVAGGAFGLLLLLRTQSLLILPVLMLLAWFVFGRQIKPWIVAAAVFLCAMAMTLAPWLAHNYSLTGRFAFDDPRQMAIIYSQYSFTGNLDLSRFDFESESLGSHMLTFSLQNPGYVAGFIANHFLNTEIGGLLSLPLIERFDGLLAPVNLYWVTWDGQLTWYNLLLVLIYLAVIAVGVGAAWHRLRWIGLTPLAFNLGYALANGISRFSSWRYNLPVDWVIYFYFAIGAVEILGGLALLFGAQAEKVFSDTPGTRSEPVAFSPVVVRWEPVLILLGFVILGSLPWLAKGWSPPRYTASREELMTRIEASGYPADEVESFLSQPEAVLVEGRLLYPRMYRRGLGMVSANPWPAYAVRNYARLGFILLNNTRTDAIFVTRDLPAVPQGVDATLLGCQREGYVEAWLLILPEKKFQAASLTTPCD